MGRNTKQAMAAAAKEFVAPEVKDVEKGEGSLPGLMGTGMSAKEKYAERMKKLRDLHMKRNHQEVVEEDRRNKEPKNMDARRRRAEYILNEEQQKAECEAAGKNWEIEKLRNVGADDAEALDRRKKAKSNADEGFSSYEQATFRKYSGLTKQIKPDMQKYEVVKANVGDAFYAEAGTIVHGVHKDSQEAIDRMAGDVIKQQEKRAKN